MILSELVDSAKKFWEEIKSAKRVLASSQSKNVNSQIERNTYEKLASRWFSDFSKVLTPYGVNEDAIKKYNAAFKAILKLASSANRRESYLRQFDLISSSFNDDIIIFLQTDAENPRADDGKELGDEAKKLLERVPDKDENEYLKEALGCWADGYLKGATVLLWCAAIDRIHKVIEQHGFESFNRTVSWMKEQRVGRFKNFRKSYKVQSISELRTVFDSDLLWILEGMQLIDTNEKTRLTSCFDMRCHSGHPGAAPITKYNVLSCFSDIVEIILSNPKFSIQELSD